MTVAYSQTPASGSNSDANASWRCVAKTTDGPQDEVRVRFRAGSTAALVAQSNNCAIGRSSGTAGNTLATPVELKFGGVSGYAFTSGLAFSLFSDWLSFGGWTAGDSLVVVMDFGSAGEHCRTPNTIVGVATTYVYGTVTPPVATFNQATPVTEDSSFADETWGIDLIEVRKTPIFIPSKTSGHEKRSLRVRSKAPAPRIFRPCAPTIIIPNRQPSRPMRVF